MIHIIYYFKSITNLTLVNIFDIKRGPSQAVSTLTREIFLIHLHYKDVHPNRKNGKIT